MINKIQHIGIAVKNLDESLKKYTQTFGFQLIHREIIEDRGIEVAVLDCKNTKIELVADYSGKSTIKKFIEKKGEGLHHVAFNVNDIQSHLDRLKGSGIKLIDENPRAGAHLSKVAFIHPENFNSVLFELCQD